MPEGNPFEYVFQPNPADYAVDNSDEPMDDPELDLDSDDVRDSAADAEAREPVPAGSSAYHAARRDSRGNPLASSARAMAMKTIIQFLRDAVLDPTELTGSYEDLVRLSAERLGAKRARVGTGEEDIDGRNEKFRRGRDGGSKRRE